MIVPPSLALLVSSAAGLEKEAEIHQSGLVLERLRWEECPSELLVV